MSRCPGPHLLSCGVCGGTDAGLLARAEAAERERNRLREALEKAKGPIAIAASYADAPEVSVGLRVHARDCARILPEINAALAGEGEVHRWESVGDFIACQQCGGLRGQASDEEVCPTPRESEGGVMREIKRLRAETDEAYGTMLAGLGVSIPKSHAYIDALAAERAAVDARLAALEEERNRLRAWLENVSWRLSQVLRLRDKSGPWSRVELIRDDAREAATLAGEAKECWCQWEAGDSPCPAHGLVTMWMGWPLVPRVQRHPRESEGAVRSTQTDAPREPGADSSILDELPTDPGREGPCAACPHSGSEHLHFSGLCTECDCVEHEAIEVQP